MGVTIPDNNVAHLKDCVHVSDRGGVGGGRGDGVTYIRVTYYNYHVFIHCNGWWL